MKKGFLFRGARSMVVLAAAAGVAFFLFTLKSGPEKKSRVETVPSADVITVMPETREMKVQAYGTVVPRKSVTLSAEVPGRVTFLHPGFEKGGIIEKGDLIVKIDQRAYELDEKMARAGVRRARADISRLDQEIVNLKASIALAEKDVRVSNKKLERLKTLTKGSFATENSVDMALQRNIQTRMRLLDLKNRLALTDTGRKQLEAVLAAEEVKLARAGLALEKSEIRADFHGCVSAKRVEKGEYLRVGESLGTLYANTLLDVNVQLSREKMRWIEPLLNEQRAPRVDIFISSAGREQVWQGRLVRTGGNIDENTRTLPVVIEVAANDHRDKGPLRLLPGTFVSCIVHGSVHENIYTVPRHLVRQGNIVSTIDSKTLVNKKVTILRRFQDRVFVVQGLLPGDRIISTPLPHAVDGMAIRARNSGDRP
ncbi:MAG: HlyD family efflux transporter periplasmic adaptor subunit [Desulfobacteraceae bacterium]